MSQDVQDINAKYQSFPVCPTGLLIKKKELSHLGVVLKLKEKLKNVM